MRPTTVYLGNNTALTRLYTGHKIYVDTRDVGIASHLMLDGNWEPWIERVIMREIAPGMTVCDVGANFGYYTLLAASKVGNQGRVYAIEANPHLAKLLRQSVAVNGFADYTEVVPVAASDAASEVILSFDSEFSGGGTTLPSTEDSQWTRSQIKVRALPLDDIVPANRRVDFMKIDVEGAEVPAIRGAKRILETPGNMSIVLEFYRPGIEHHESALIRLLDALEGWPSGSFAAPLGATASATGV